MAKSGGFGRRGLPVSTGSAAEVNGPGTAAGRSPLLRVAGLALAVVGFAVGAWAGREAVQQMFAFRLSGELDKRMSDMERLARAKYPHLDPVEALSLYAREAAPGEVNNSKSDRERTMKAAATFMGFYHINTRSRVEHCAKLGVNIAPFTSRFERNHRREYERALAIAATVGMTEERSWKMVRSQLGAMVKADMESIARRVRKTPAGACETLVDRAEEFADKLDFATLQPQVRRILMGS